MRPILNTLAALAVYVAGLHSAAADAPATATPDDLLLRAHFVGATTGTNAAHLRQILTQPTTTNYLSITLNQFATLPYTLAKSAASTNTHQADLRPLLEDVVRSECFLEIHGTNLANTETTFAIKLDVTAAQRWSANLSNTLTDWTGAKPVLTSNGWEIKKQGAASLARLSVTNGWLFFGLGQATLPHLEAWLKQLPTADTNALSVWVDAGRLHAGWPQAQLAWNGEGDALRLNGTLDFPTAFDFKAHTWLVPTNLIREPLAGFSAVQDPLAGWLQNTAFFRAISAQPVANQLYTWTLGQMPVQLFMAAPCEDTTNTLHRLSAKVAELGKTNIPSSIGIIHAATNNSSAYWEGLPFVTPFLCGAKDVGHDYLMVGMSANSTLTNKLPAELLNRVAGRTNLVAYEWEVTQPRVAYWHQINQLFRMVCNRPSIQTNAPGFQFLASAAPLLGNTVTEVTATGTNQLTITRKSDLGLTAFELTLLTEWIGSSKFPQTEIVWPPNFEHRRGPLPGGGPGSPTATARPTTNRPAGQP